MQGGLDQKLGGIFHPWHEGDTGMGVLVGWGEQWARTSAGGRERAVFVVLQEHVQFN